MKIALKISLILNLVLLACLLFAWTGQHDNKTVLNLAEAGPTLADAPPSPQVATTVPQTLSSSEQAPFRWSQLESDNYQTYVKNLRAIGCPESTLRAIVTADVDNAYAIESRTLEQELIGLQNGSWSEQLTTYNRQQDLTAKLQQLPGEESAEIDNLLGIQAKSATMASTPRFKPSPRQPSITVPVVMGDIDLSSLNLNPRQKQAFDDVRQQFLTQIGGGNQDPSDPAYIARWQKAQATADSMLEGTLGNETFMKIQVLEHQKALAYRQ